MRRGEIRLVDLEPASGAAANRRRPAVIVSDDGANASASRLGRGVIDVVPVTSSIARVFPFQVLLRSSDTGLPHDSKAHAEQIRAVAVERVGARIGMVPGVAMTALDEALRLHLAL